MSSNAQADVQALTPAVERQNFLLTWRAYVRVGIDMVVGCLSLWVVAAFALGLAQKTADFGGTVHEYLAFLWCSSLAATALVSSVSVWSICRLRRPKASLISLLIFLGLSVVPFVVPALSRATVISLVFAPWAIVGLALLVADRILTEQVNRIGDLPSSRIPARKRIIRVFAIPLCLFTMAVCAYGAYLNYSQFGKAIQSTAWPQTKAQVSCELVNGDGKFCTQYDVSYEFSVDGQMYTGDTDGLLTVKQHSFSTRAKERVAELKSSDDVMVSYHPDDPANNMLTTGVNTDLLMSVLPSMHVVGLFLFSFAWLLIVHRQTTDGPHVARTFSPIILVLKFVFITAYAAAILYYILSMFWLGAWAFALVIWISFNYTLSKRIMKAVDREGEEKLKDGKIVVWGMGHELSGA